MSYVFSHFSASLYYFRGVHYPTEELFLLFCVDFPPSKPGPGVKRCLMPGHLCSVLSGMYSRRMPLCVPPPPTVILPLCIKKECRTMRPLDRNGLWPLPPSPCRAFTSTYCCGITCRTTKAQQDLDFIHTINYFSYLTTLAGFEQSSLSLSQRRK